MSYERSQSLSPKKEMTTTGKIIQILGPIVDIRFDSSATLPGLLNALEVIREDGYKIILECQLHLGDYRKNSRRHILPREHANRCHLGYQ
jgi:F0F1-type ATP synthase beta subunit